MKGHPCAQKSHIQQAKARTVGGSKVFAGVTGCLPRHTTLPEHLAPKPTRSGPKVALDGEASSDAVARCSGIRGSLRPR